MVSISKYIQAFAKQCSYTSFCIQKHFAYRLSPSVSFDEDPFFRFDISYSSRELPVLEEDMAIACLPVSDDSRKSRRRRLPSCIAWLDAASVIFIIGPQRLSWYVTYAAMAQTNKRKK